MAALKYVIGFVFSSDFQEVLLVHKNRPDWQKGYINGPGGKVESGETFRQAVSREIREETDLVISPKSWKRALRMNQDGNIIDVFGALLTGDKEQAKTTTDETVEWFLVNKLPANVRSNLNWMIPLVIYKLQKDNYSLASISYKLGATKA